LDFSSPSVHPALPDQPKSSPLAIDYSQGQLDSLNAWLQCNGKEPIDMHKLKHQQSYLVKQLEKVREILECFRGVPIGAKSCLQSDSVESWYRNALSFKEMLWQLQEHFIKAENNSEKVHILSVLPKSWSHQQIRDSFNASKHMVELTKSLVAENGVFCSTNKKTGSKVLPEGTITAVKEFYCRQDISRELPGKNNYVSVKENGTRVKKTKRLVLGNLSHIYDLFVEEFPNHKISFSKFAELRPRECCLASNGGMHNVCVCTIHENPKLMFEGANLKRLVGWKSVSECVKMLVCSEPSAKCYLRTCENCPDSNALREKLEVSFDEAMIDSVTYNQWESTDRSTVQ